MDPTLADAPIPPHVPRRLVVDFDVYDPPGAGEDIHAAYARFQRETPEPLVWTPRHGGHWIAVRGRDVFDIHADHERFSSTINTVPAPPKPLPLGALSLDPPEHGPFRAALNSGLSPRAVRDLEPSLRALSVELIEGFRPRGGCEFIREFADVVPLAMFLTLVDLPQADRPMLAEWAAWNTRSSDPKVRDEGARKIRRYLEPYLEQRRAHPGEDMLSRVARIEVEGRPISPDEALGAATHLMIAGLDTVSSLLGFVTLFLARNRAHRRELIADPRRVPAAAHELIRRFPLVVMARQVREDMVLHGVTLKRGDVIAVPTMFYNLDQEVYPDPLAVDWTRKVPDTCTFGAGVHRCPGALLGRAELAVALEEWLKRIPDFRVEPGRTVRVNGGIVATVSELPLRWDDA